MDGWLAQGNDVYASVAKKRIANMQKMVVDSFQNKADAIAEKKRWEHLRNFLPRATCVMRRSNFELTGPQ